MDKRIEEAVEAEKRQVAINRVNWFITSFSKVFGFEPPRDEIEVLPGEDDDGEYQNWYKFAGETWNLDYYLQVKVPCEREVGFFKKRTVKDYEWVTIHKPQDYERVKDGQG